MSALVLAGALFAIAAVIWTFALLVKAIVFILWVCKELYYEHLAELQRQGKL